LKAAGEGELRALYIVGEDLLNTSPEAATYRACLESCEFVVLQEMAFSETTRYADVILPNVSFAEKTGTFTSTERRIQMVSQAIDPYADAWPDWQIFTNLAVRLGFKWNYTSTAQIMEEIAKLTPIYAGITHERLAKEVRLQWPVGSKKHLGTPILPLGLFTDGKVKWYKPEKTR